MTCGGFAVDRLLKDNSLFITWGGRGFIGDEILLRQFIIYGMWWEDLQGAVGCLI